MSVSILQGDVREQLATLPAESVQCVVTSPPYFQLRSYLGADHPDKAKELGSERTPVEFIEHLVSIFDEVRRVMRPGAVLFVNLGDSYAGSGKGTPGPNALVKHTERQGFTGAGADARNGTAPVHKTGGAYGVKPKSLLLIPERFALAMMDAGWIVRSRIAWCKTSAMPESVRDRPTSAWEVILMFTKQARYFWDQDAGRFPALQPAGEPRLTGQHASAMTQYGGKASSRLGTNQGPSTANMRNFWLLGPEPSKEQHYAAFPSEIPRRCILAASRRGDTILDPFLGSGTTALVADQLGRNAIGIELSPQYVEISRRRITNDCPMFTSVELLG